MKIRIKKTFPSSKAKPADVCNFYNNVESIWDHLCKINKCFRLDRKTEYMVESGAADKVKGEFYSLFFS